MPKFIVTGSDVATKAMLAAGMIAEEELDDITAVVIELRVGEAAKYTVHKLLCEEQIESVITMVADD